MPEVHRTMSGQGTSTPPPPISLEVTPEMLRTLQQMSRNYHQPLEVLFTRAIGLYQAALKAAADGKHVGYAASPDALDVEFTGIANSEDR